MQTLEQIRVWYEVELRSYRWIMEKIGTKSARKMKKLIIESGAKIRDRSSAVAAQWINNDSRRKLAGDTANKNFYFTRLKKKSPETLKKMSDVKLGEKNPMFGRNGDMNPHFYGGKKTWDKGRKIRKDRKEEIIKHFGSVCNRCGETKRNLLTINHKIPWREVRHHELWNLECLCKKCHFSGPIRLR